MAKFDVSDTKALQTAVENYLNGLAANLICALQIWYEGLGGQGVPDAAEMTAIQNAVVAAPGWKEAGDVRYEKFGVQRSYKRA